jgi:hypothetical protein
MSATANGTADGQQPATPKWSRRRKVSVVITVAACAVAVGLFLPTALAGWAPVLHWTCKPGVKVTSLTNWAIPAVLVNSPYGGSAWGNGTFPPTFPGISRGAPGNVYAIAYGTGAGNGETQGAFFTVNVSIYRQGNATELGPGMNVRCSQPFRAVLSAPPQYVEIGGEVQGPNNTSDAGEPTHVILPAEFQDNWGNVTFSNSFGVDNTANVSTCGLPARSYPSVTSNRLDVWFPVTVDGQSLNVSYVIPVDESYNYIFPANFGTWQVDNLSAPGGPGGGWAFSYLPCP